MSKYQYNINGVQFNSKKSVMDYVKNNIHSKYGLDEEISSDHLKFMVSLLRHHLWSDQKMGVGVQKMWLEKDKIYGSKCFWLERLDGTKTDFSFSQCLSPSSPLRDFKGACRRAIESVVIEFRNDCFRHERVLICPILNKEMTSYDCHVDHEPPATFEAIVNSFIESRSVDIENAPILEHNDGKIGNCFVDSAFEKDWIDYHNERAKLRVVSIEANLSHIKKEANKIKKRPAKRTSVQKPSKRLAQSNLDYLLFEEEERREENKDV